MGKIKIEYRGKKDKKELIGFLEKINNEVKDKSMPTNLYTFTDSPLDIAIIDFYNFDIEEISENSSDLCAVTIRNNKGTIINHFIIRPNTSLLVEYTIESTAGTNPYDYLALRFVVESL